MAGWEWSCTAACATPLHSTGSGWASRLWARTLARAASPVRVRSAFPSRSAGSRSRPVRGSPLTRTASSCCLPEPNTGLGRISRGFAAPARGIPGQNLEVTVRDRTPVQSIAALVGLVFLVVGILGFIPGITTHYSDLGFAGHDSGAKLLGIFQTSVLHNLIHIAFGVGILMARTPEGARTYLIGGGVAYLVVWL